MWYDNNELIYDKEIKYIKQFDKFILISSNVGSYIHRDNIGNKKYMEKSWFKKYKSDILRSDNYIKFSKFKFYKFKKMIEALSKEFSEQKIILRPHPSENIKK